MNLKIWKLSGVDLWAASVFLGGVIAIWAGIALTIAKLTLGFSALNLG